MNLLNLSEEEHFVKVESIGWFDPTNGNYFDYDGVMVYMLEAIAILFFQNGFKKVIRTKDITHIDFR